MTLTPGEKLGPYEIISPLGAGGMGEVYRAKDARLGREVAIKVLLAGFAVDSERLKRFELEARATGALNHPNVLWQHATALISVSGTSEPVRTRPKEWRGAGGRVHREAVGGLSSRPWR